MSVAYSRNAAYDYRRFEETAETAAQQKPQIAVRPAPRHALMLRRALVLLTAIAAAAVCIGFLYMKAQVFKVQREVNDIRKDIAAAEKLNSNLSEQLSEAMDINTIMEKATALGMGYPSDDQVLYVSANGSGTSMEMKK